VFSNFFRKSCLYNKMWKNTVERGRPQMIIWRMRISCWIPNATNTHSEYITLKAFPLEQRLHERASMLRCTYTACLVSNNFKPRCSLEKGDRTLNLSSQFPVSPLWSTGPPWKNPWEVTLSGLFFLWFSNNMNLRAVGY